MFFISLIGIDNIFYTQLPSKIRLYGFLSSKLSGDEMLTNTINAGLVKLTNDPLKTLMFPSCVPQAVIVYAAQSCGLRPLPSGV